MSEHSLAAAAVAARRQRELTKSLLDIALISILAMASFAYSGLGFIGSDDSGYIGAARAWVQAVPPVSDFFGDLRYPVILPIALSIMLFGDAETTVGVPTLLYAWGSILVTYFGMKSIADRATALIAAVLLAVSPLLAGLATTPGVDVCELFFVAVSLFAFFVGTQRGLAWPIFFVSGLSAGLAFMSRESSISLLVFYGIMFLSALGPGRKMFWVMAIGFATIFVSEIVWYTLADGDPLHRVRLVAMATGKPDPNMAAGPVDMNSGRVFNISPMLDPFLFVLSHPQFGLVFPAALVALSARVFGKKEIASFPKPLFAYFCILGGVSFLVSAYALSHLALLPRYFLVPLFCAILVVSIWLRSGLWLQQRWLYLSAAVLLLLAALLGQMIPNKSPLFAERVLLTVARSSDETIHTDPETGFRGKLLYQWGNVASKISTSAPLPGDLFLYNAKFAATRTPRNRGLELEVYQPKKNWLVQHIFSEKPSMLGRLITALGGADHLPKALMRRIVEPNPSVTLYRLKS